jgi:flagellar hook-associated protein FlgK
MASIDGSMVNQGLIGMQRSQAEMVRSAEQIASVATAPADAPAGTQDLVEPLINMRAQQQVFDSSARVVQAADEMLGRLIDTSA